MRNFFIRLSSVILGLVIFVNDAIAVELSYVLSTEARASDNIRETENGKSGSSLSTGLVFTISSKQNSNWSGQIDGSYTYESFFGDSTQDQEYKNLFGNITYQSEVNNFTLRLLESLSQAPRNRFATETVGNLRTIQTFSIIPAYFIGISALDRVNFEFAYVDLQNDDVIEGNNAFNASRTTRQGTISYERQLNSTQHFFINANKLETEFDSNEGIDFDQEDYSLRWVVTGRATNIQLEYGVSKLSDQFGNDADANLVSVRINRQINRTQSVNFLVRSGFDTEINQDFSTDSVSLNVETKNFITAQKVLDINFLYDYLSDSFNSSINLFSTKLEEANGMDKERQMGVELSLSYPVSRLIWGNDRGELEFSAAKIRRKFERGGLDINNSENNLRIISLAYRYSFNNNFSLFVKLNQRKAERGLSGINLSMADSNSISIGVRFSPSTKF